MKTINKIIMSLGVAATALGFSSCVGDLDREPNNPNDITSVTDDMDRVFSDIYLNFATFGANGSSPVMDFDGGMAGFQRAISIAEEYPTDEMAWLWDPNSYGTLNYGMVTPSLDCVFGFYSRLVINITLCNQFIQLAQDGGFRAAEGETEAQFNARRDEYVRQAKILWGLCYYYMLSFYDKVPYADQTTSVGTLPVQLPRAEVYQRVTATLEEVVASYEQNQKPNYGFVGLDAAEAVLAKIYLNGEVFAGRGDYEKCYQHSKNIIDRLGNGGHYGNGLARSYLSLFGYNNSRFVLGKGGNVNEIIFSLVADQTHLLNWAGATYLLSAWLGDANVVATLATPTDKAELDGEVYTTTVDKEEVKRYYKYYANASDYEAALNAFNGKGADGKDLPDDQKPKDWTKNISETVHGVHYSFDPKATYHVAMAWYNSADKWGCLVTRKSFVRKFEWNDVKMSLSDDTRVSLWQTSSHGFVVENPTLLGDDFGKNGYLAPKFSNWAYNDDGTVDYDNSPGGKNGPTLTKQLGVDYPVIRLAEIYLTAAEAILNGGGGSQAEALKYVNYLRERAYGDKDHNWTSLSMQELRDERARELYQENVRRTDLIRWNQWCTGYTWEWKGGVQSGTNLPEYTKLYPIPTRVMSSSNFEQTTGY